MAYDSVETWRLYSAEASLKQPRPSSPTAATNMATRITSSIWWNQLPITPAPTTITLGGRDDNGMTISSVTPDREANPTHWNLNLHPERATPRTVIHELAHTITPRFAPGPQLVPLHGQAFAGIYVEMLTAFSTEAEQLIDAFDHFEVKRAAPHEWRAAAVTSSEIEDLIVSRVLNEPIRAKPSLARELRAARQRSGVTLEQASAALGASISDLELMERDLTKAAFNRVSSRHLHRPAMTLNPFHLGVLYGVDPVVLAEVFGYQWELATEGDLLRELNTEWVDQVEHLNALAEERPPWWERRSHPPTQGR